MSTSPLSFSFSPQPLYAGALTASLPQNYIDSSTLRQIPDHQEVYLSPTTLTSVVFEINAYVEPEREPKREPVGVSDSRIAAEDGDGDAAVTTPASAAGAGADPPSQAPANTMPQNDNDAAASLYHLRDLIDPTDVLTILQPPQRVKMQRLSLADAPAFFVRGKVSSGRIAAVQSVPEEMGESMTTAASEALQTTTMTTIRHLLVRLEAYGTDLCVVVNVPWKGLGSGGEGVGETEVEEEEAVAESILEAVVGSLDVSDFGLFVG